MNISQSEYILQEETEEQHVKLWQLEMRGSAERQLFGFVQQGRE